MSVWSIDWMTSASGGRLIRRPRGVSLSDPVVAGVSVDTRTLTEGEAFVALRGERFDGHGFVGEAAARGCAVVLLERESAAAGLPDHVAVIRVHNARDALTKLALAHRSLLTGTRVIAVTGSNGKTTTVRFLDAALRVAMKGSSSAKSFNNDVGVPLTILRARPGDDFLVCEVGMNSPGEIAPLARMIEPDIGVITSVGRAHLEEFGSVEAIGREKASLLQFLRPGGVAVVNAACEPLLGDAARTVANLVRVGDSPDADLRVANIAHQDRGAQTVLTFEVHDAAGVGGSGGTRAFSAPTPGTHNAVNASLAIAVARLLGVSDDDIARGLAAVRPPDMRMQRWRIGEVEVFNDAYNASPESTEAAIRTFCDLAKDAARRVIVFGDMLELGDHGADAHREIGDTILVAGEGAFGGAIDSVVCVGELALFTAERLLREWDETRISMFHEARPEIAVTIAKTLRPGDAVLLKGSRRMKLEAVEQALRDLADNRHTPTDRVPRQVVGGRPDPLASAG